MSYDTIATRHINYQINEIFSLDAPKMQRIRIVTRLNRVETMDHRQSLGAAGADSARGSQVFERFGSITFNTLLVLTKELYNERNQLEGTSVSSSTITHRIRLFVNLQYPMLGSMPAVSVGQELLRADGKDSMINCIYIFWISFRVSIGEMRFLRKSYV